MNHGNVSARLQLASPCRKDSPQSLWWRAVHLQQHHAHVDLDLVRLRSPVCPRPVATVSSSRLIYTFGATAKPEGVCVNDIRSVSLDRLAEVVTWSRKGRRVRIDFGSVTLRYASSKFKCTNDEQELRPQTGKESARSGAQ
ncbi:hypothetical protein ZHAS_00000342 [Anopheles sinensis]|uniref:Uncharacterized protein n=1 Tax=Anopheles sinensis TaxID=74873 RepID=A0A084VA43_ANOSI|nr:hypothetical protein ZHAS_00000342 [Anopheles sinensis]